MLLKDFDYFLPKELIAQEPLKERDASRLMVLDRKGGTIEHCCFRDLPACIKKGDLLVANNTRVLPARLYGKKQSGGWVELFLLNPVETGEKGDHVWECLLKSRRKIKPMTRVYFNPLLEADVLEPAENQVWRVRLFCKGNFDEVLSSSGRPPLPPYIKREREDSAEQADRERYQTVYARHAGAVAAPTAGFHFTRSLMDKIEEKGAEFDFVTLHVGLGTFQPIREDIIESHTMHKEFFQVTRETAEKVSRAAKEGRRVVAVGTTSARVLEASSPEKGMMQSGEGYTDLYIYPGYSFKAVNAMVTNFHLPLSSLLLLVSAFAGKDFIMEAYRKAVEEKYRFFSYGDAMLIV